MAKVSIVGAGIIGVCSAYYLMRRGFEVVLIDEGKEDDMVNCSYGNAGMVVPSHFVPLAAPGAIAKGLRWLFKSTSPFSIQPHFNRDLATWLRLFYQHATEKHVAQSAHLLRDLNLHSKSLYQAISADEEFDFGWTESGLLMLYQTEACAREEEALAREANALGIRTEQLNKKEVINRQGVKVNALGGVLFPDDAHLNPAAFMQGMCQLLKANGVKIKRGVRITGLKKRGNRIEALETTAGEEKADEIVLATGAWSAQLVKPLGLKLPLLPGKGYSFNLESKQETPAIPSILCEAKVAVTPFGNQTRFAGTLEIGQLNHTINYKRLEGIKNAVGNYWPELEKAVQNHSKPWVGLRPCSPDGLPYVGKMVLDNLTIATGHAMMGVSLGPVTGQLVADLLSKTTPAIDCSKLLPERFR